MSRPNRYLLAAAAFAAFFIAGAASAQHSSDPPYRVARISDMRGDLSYSPAGDGDWYDAHRNRPLVSGDALWTDQGARAELQAGSTWVRMDGETSLQLTQVDDRMLQMEVAEGSVNVRVRRLYPGQRVEVDTPNLAFVIDRPGNFRVDVDRDGDNTTIEARSGGGRVYGVGGRFDVRNGDVVVFYGEDVRDYEMYAFPAQDEFDRYARMRDQRVDRSVSLRYLGSDVIGYSDLDQYGRWSRYPEYGAVWFPNNVDSGWAPYQDGQWVWQEPWGWTWVDDEPWGFAPSHYGRWASVDGRWGWVPGQRTYRPVYAPALVAFLELAGGSVGWFPLAPTDVYYPTYNVSSNYFRAVNVANTTVSPTLVNSRYTSYGRASAVPLAQGAYRNRTVPTAVTAVPQDVFVNSRPVREARREQRELAAATPPRGLEMRRNLGVRPDRASVLGAAPKARVRPPRAIEEEQVIVHNAPPATATPPSATNTPAPAAPVRERQRHFRQITEQQASSDARARGPRHEGVSAAAATPPATPAATTPASGGGRLHALDRSALPRERGERRVQQREQVEVNPAAAAPATPVRPAEPGARPELPANAAARARDAQEAVAAQQKAREEQRQAAEAQRKAMQEKRESEQALHQAQQQREQAQAANDARQQREAADAEAKAVQQRQQARAAQMEAQRQQRESQQAQRQAVEQQAQAAQQQAAQQQAQKERQAQQQAAQQQAQKERQAQQQAAAQQQAQQSAAAQQQAQAREAQREAALQQRQAQQAAEQKSAREAAQQQAQAQAAQREAAQQQRQAQQAAQQQQAKREAAPQAAPATTPAPANTEAAGPRGAGPRRECVPQERIDTMRKNGVPEERLAELKACPVQPQPQQQ